MERFVAYSLGEDVVEGKGGAIERTDNKLDQEMAAEILTFPRSVAICIREGREKSLLVVERKDGLGHIEHHRSAWHCSRVRQLSKRVTLVPRMQNGEQKRDGK